MFKHLFLGFSSLFLLSCNKISVAPGPVLVTILVEDQYGLTFHPDDQIFIGDKSVVLRSDCHNYSSDSTYFKKKIESGVYSVSVPSKLHYYGDSVQNFRIFSDTVIRLRINLLDI